MVEEWKSVIGYEGHFEVSNLGRVRSIKWTKTPRFPSRIKKRKYIGPRVFKPQPARGGYLQVCLSKDNHRHSYSLHRLVAAAFIPNPEGKPQVNHKNSDRSDNSVTNLEWVTPLENMQHGAAYGNIDNRGEKNTLSKLTREDVRKIRFLYPMLTQYKLAKLFGVDVSNIGYIVNRVTWIHV